MPSAKAAGADLASAMAVHRIATVPMTFLKTQNSPGARLAVRRAIALIRFSSATITSRLSTLSITRSKARTRKKHPGVAVVDVAAAAAVAREEMLV